LLNQLFGEFHTALGQFINYRFVLSQEQPERILYLAVPLDTYNTFFKLPFTQMTYTAIALGKYLSTALQTLDSERTLALPTFLRRTVDGRSSARRYYQMLVKSK
jgi:hypothetical protein